MSVFPKTAPPPGTSPARASASRSAPAPPSCGLLRDLVLAVRDLADPAWLDASGDDPDMAAFTVLGSRRQPARRRPRCDSSPPGQ